MADFEESEEETCWSIAPWLDDNDKPVRCQVPKGLVHDNHGGNGWTWTYDAKHNHNYEFLEIQSGIYVWVCDCGDEQFFD